MITLQENLDRRLQEQQARETGICSIRDKLYSQCFGESFNSLSREALLAICIGSLCPYLVTLA